MRTTLEIIEAVKDSKPVTEQELKLALMVLESGHTRYFRAIGKVLGKMKGENLGNAAKVSLMLLETDWEEIFVSLKKDPEYYLGPNHIPGTPEHDKLYQQSKAIFEKFLKSPYNSQKDG